MHLAGFINQRSYERVIYQVRKHPITLVPALATGILLLAVPIAIYWLTTNIAPAWLENELIYTILVLAGSIYTLSVLMFVFTYFVTFYLDLLIITNDRLLHIEQQGLFSRSISEVDLNNIQDASSEIDGFIPSLFKFGTLIIQTAGATEKFIIHDIPNPDHLRQTILNLSEEERARRKAGQTPL